jgi:hypothetical protein
MLCDKCSNIHFKRSEDCDLIKQEPERLKDKDDYAISGCVFYIHHRDRQELEKSADKSCHFCGMLWGRLFVDPEGSGVLHPSSYSFARRKVILRRSIVESWIEKESGLEGWNKGDWIYINCGDRNATTTSVHEQSGKFCLDTIVDEIQYNYLVPVEAILDALTIGTNNISHQSSNAIIPKSGNSLAETESEGIPLDLVPAQNPLFYAPMWTFRRLRLRV